MTSEVDPGFSRSWLPGVWGQWLILSYVPFSGSWENSICLRRPFPDVDVGMDT